MCEREIIICGSTILRRAHHWHIERRVWITVIISAICEIKRPRHAKRILHCLHVRGSREAGARKFEYLFQIPRQVSERSRKIIARILPHAILCNYFLLLLVAIFIPVLLYKRKEKEEKEINVSLHNTIWGKLRNNWDYSSKSFFRIARTTLLTAVSPAYCTNIYRLEWPKANPRREGARIEVPHVTNDCLL